MDPSIWTSSSNLVDEDDETGLSLMTDYRGAFLLFFRSLKADLNN